MSCSSCGKVRDEGDPAGEFGSIATARIVSADITRATAGRPNALEDAVQVGVD